MSIVPREAWYTDLVGFVEAQHGDAKDRLGRPWYQHFERVALRLIFRLPGASRAQVQAALLHDAMMGGGGGRPLLNRLGVDEEAIRIIALTTPPPHGDYFRALEAITPADNAIYRNYVEQLGATNDHAAIHVKLADFQDTCDMLSEARTPELKAQLRDRYQPARDRLLALVEKPGELGVPELIALS